MLVMQENRMLRSYGLALRRDRLMKEVILHPWGKLLHIRITASPNARVI
jgi:hypothetical protein